MGHSLFQTGRFVGFKPWRSLSSATDRGRTRLETGESACQSAGPDEDVTRLACRGPDRAGAPTNVLPSRMRVVPESGAALASGRRQMPGLWLAGTGRLRLVGVGTPNCRTSIDRPNPRGPGILREMPPTRYACRARRAHWGESGTGFCPFRSLGSWSARRENKPRRKISDRHLTAQQAGRASAPGLLEFHEYRLQASFRPCHRRGCPRPPSSTRDGPRGNTSTPRVAVHQSRHPPLLSLVNVELSCYHV